MYLSIQFILCHYIDSHLRCTSTGYTKMLSKRGILYFVYTHIWIWCKNILLILPRWLCRNGCPVSGYVMAQVIQLENFFLTKKGKANLFLSSLFSRYVVLKWQQQVFVIIELKWYWCSTVHIWHFYLQTK